MKRQASQDSVKSQSSFHHKLQSGQIAPLYLFEGTEVYLRDQALKKLADAAIDMSVRDFNYAVISVAQGDLDEALAQARQFPMISPRRMIVVTGFETISDDDQLELLKNYIRKPVESSVLVFVSNGLDNRRNISTILRKGCEVVSFEALDERTAAPNWIRDYVARSGCAIDPASAAYLIGTVGVNLMQLAMELDKLIAYVGEKGGITQDDIDLLVRHSREHSNFELTDAVVDGDRKKALKLLHRIFDNASENPQSLSLMILGAIASNYRRMLGAKELMKQNAPNSEVAKIVGMSPYAVGHFNERVRRVETDRILKGIERIAATDVALKTSRATPRLLLEVLICELCPPEPERRPGFGR